MSDPIPAAGVALFVGSQDRFNGVVDAPPRPYLIRVSPEEAARSRSQAHQGVRSWQGRDLYLDFFVDPETRIVFGQPDQGEDAATRARWFAQDRGAWAFKDAKNLSRWLELYRRYLDDRTPRSKLVHRLPEFWLEYLRNRRPDAAPVALGLPEDPAAAFADAGWSSWSDFFWEERARQEAP